jgi:FAD/FMN-containing dehydrogenase
VRRRARDRPLADARVDVDGEARTARAEGGATWLDFDAATQAFGLVTPGGVVGSTGVAGLTYGGAGVRDALRRYRDLAARAPRDLNCHAVLEADESLAPTLAVTPCYTGLDSDPEELCSLRSATGLFDDGLRVHSFLDQQRVFDSPYGEDRKYWKGHFVRELPDELIDELLRRVVALRRPPGEILIESLHGATGDADPTSAALGFREAAFNISVMASWQDPALDDAYIEWARDTAAANQPWSVSGGYVNYMQADEPIERVRAAFGVDAFERLRALKRRHDPDNVLDRNQNIPPP